MLAALRIGAPLCSLLLVLAVSRTLGAEGLGRYSLAYAYLGLCSLLAPLGLPVLLTREAARDRAGISRLLSNALTLGGNVSLVLTTVMAGAGIVLNSDLATARSLLILSLAVLPSTWCSYLEAAFLGLHDPKAIAMAAAAEHVLKVGAGMPLLLAGFGLNSVLGAAVAGRAVACAVLIVLLRRREVAVSLGFDRGVLKRLARQAPVFAGSAVCATLYWRADVFLLAHFRPLTEVGGYSAAYRLLDMAILLPQSFCQALYPQMAGEPRGEPAQRRASLGKLLLLTAPIALLVTLLGRPLLTMFYGQQFALAAPVVAVLIWTAVPYAWNRYHACVLVASDRQHADLAINVALLVVNVALNLILIPFYGALGAALVTLGTAVLYGAAQRMYLRGSGALSCPEVLCESRQL